MSLCPLSWNHIQRINREYGRKFLTISASSNGVLIGVEERGVTWAIDRQAHEIYKAGFDTSTSVLLREGLTGKDSWSDILRQRKRELERESTPDP